MTARRGIVRIAGERCGVIEEIDAGRTRFAYDRAWRERPLAQPVSLLLPIRAEPYESQGLHPFFANLLPEGWLLDISLAKLKIARDDAFGLLLAVCADCMGAVEVVRDEGEAP